MNSSRQNEIDAILLLLREIHLEEVSRNDLVNKMKYDLHEVLGGMGTLELKKLTLQTRLKELEVTGNEDGL